MNDDDLPTAGLPRQSFIAALCGGIAYPVIGGALRLVRWQADAGRYRKSIDERHAR